MDEPTLKVKLLTLMLQANDISDQITAHCKKLIPDYSPFHVLSQKECNLSNPMGLCCFDTKIDPEALECLFCKKPHQEK